MDQYIQSGLKSAGLYKYSVINSAVANPEGVQGVPPHPRLLNIH